MFVDGVNVEDMNEHVIKQEDYSCHICKDDDGELVMLPNEHIFHMRCLHMWFKESNQLEGQQKCPYCTRVIDWTMTRKVVV